jgi:hypothetical protein
VSQSSDIALAQELATRLNTDWVWMYSLINFESRWNPLAKNSKSGAMGLIQFIDSTAQGLGYKSAADLVAKNPDSASQIRGPVYQHLKMYAPFPTEQSLYMSVFYPAWRDKPPLEPLPARVLAANPKIDTAQAYINKVRSARPGWFNDLVASMGITGGGAMITEGGAGLDVVFVLMLSVAAYMIFGKK